MLNISARFPMCAAILLACVGFAPTAHATTTVNCATTNLSTAIATAISVSKPGQTLTLDVKGSCVTHLSIPQGVNIVLTGVGTTGIYGATITANDANSVITVNGTITLNKIQVTTTGAPNAVVQLNSGAIANVNNSNITSATTMAIAGTQAFFSILNSTISGGGNGALELQIGSTALVQASAGGHTTIKYTDSAGAEAIGCYDSSLYIGTSGTGTVTIGPSTGALMFARGCGATIGDGASPKSIFFSSGGYVGLNVFGSSSIKINNTTFASTSGGAAIAATAGTVEIDNSTISVPSGAIGLQAKLGGTIFFQGNANSVTRVTYPYSCYQNGHIYADTAPLGGATSNGCLTVGGAYSN